jgi:hypothetical protein
MSDRKASPPGPGRDGAEDERDENGADEEWQFSLEDIEQREAEAAAEAKAEKRRAGPIEAGDPTLEGTVFVLLGIAIAIFVLSRLFVG